VRVFFFNDVYHDVHRLKWTRIKSAYVCLEFYTRNTQHVDLRRVRETTSSQNIWTQQLRGTQQLKQMNPGGQLYLVSRQSNASFPTDGKKRSIFTLLQNVLDPGLALHPRERGRRTAWGRSVEASTNLFSLSSTETTNSENQDKQRLHMSTKPGLHKHMTHTHTLGVLNHDV